MTNTNLVNNTMTLNSTSRTVIWSKDDDTRYPVPVLEARAEG